MPGVERSWRAVSLPRRCSILLLALCSVWLHSDERLSAQAPATWLEYAAKPDAGVFQRFASLLYRRVGAISPTPARSTLNTLDQLLDAVADHVGRPGTLFVVTNANTINAAVMARRWDVVRAAGLEPVTPRIWGQSIYAFAREGAPPASNAPAYVYWMAPSGAPVAFRAEAALAQLGYAAPRITIVSQVKNLIEALNTSADAVAIVYDQEPSAVISQLIRGLTVKVRMLPTAKTDSERLIETGGVVSMLADYETLRFYPALENSAKVAPPEQILVSTTLPVADGALPILLTNARSTGALGALQQALGTSLQKAASEAYVLALYEYGETRCNRHNKFASEQFGTALLNNYFINRDNPYAVVGLLGHLASGDPEQLALFLEIAKQAHHLSGREGSDVIAWLQERTGESPNAYQHGLEIKQNLRAQFAGHARQDDYDRAKSELFVDAQALLKSASNDLDIGERCTALKGVRNTLATLAAASLATACGQPRPTRGLWSGIDFEPYFYLTVIDTIMGGSKCQ